MEPFCSAYRQQVLYDSQVKSFSRFFISNKIKGKSLVAVFKRPKIDSLKTLRDGNEMSSFTRSAGLQLF